MLTEVFVFPHFSFLPDVWRCCGGGYIRCRIYRTTIFEAELADFQLNNAKAHLSICFACELPLTYRMSLTLQRTKCLFVFFPITAVCGYFGGWGVVLHSKGKDGTTGP